MKKYFLAVDIGASSGRHILASVEGGKIVLEEVFRFPNGPIADSDGQLVWDYEELFRNIVRGLAECRKRGKIPCSMAIDTWGVDFLLLDGADRVIGKSVSYRDRRTEGIDTEVAKLVSDEELYERTGIQKMPFNTVYQIAALKKSNPEQLEAAKTMLLMPDYLNFRLTGVKHTEYTIASTTNLVNAGKREFDTELIHKLGYPAHLFPKLHKPGETVGNLRPEIKNEIGFDLTVLHAPSHDTASAVAAIPTNSEYAAYLSSGTWSLMGIESFVPLISKEAREANFTNEGGVFGRYRFLKNIMGLWIIQCLRKENDNRYSFAEMSEMARKTGNTGLRIRVNDNAFLSPDSMTQAILNHLGLKALGLSEMLSVVFFSLADSYAETIEEIRGISGRKIDALHIIGGGSQNTYLCELTAKTLDIPVFAGPTEATAIGNILSQMLAGGIFTSLSEARSVVFSSFEVKKIEVE